MEEETRLKLKGTINPTRYSKVSRIYVYISNRTQNTRLLLLPLLLLGTLNSRSIGHEEIVPGVLLSLSHRLLVRDFLSEDRSWWGLVSVERVRHDIKKVP